MTTYAPRCIWLTWQVGYFLCRSPQAEALSHFAYRRWECRPLSLGTLRMLSRQSRQSSSGGPGHCPSFCGKW